MEDSQYLMVDYRGYLVNYWTQQEISGVIKTTEIETKFGTVPSLLILN